MKRALDPHVREELEKRIQAIEAGEVPDPMAPGDWFLPWVVTIVVVFLFGIVIASLLWARG